MRPARNEQAEGFLPLNQKKMMNKKSIYIFLVAIFLTVLPVQGNFVGTSDGEKTIRVSPPAPQSTDAERQQELANRRAAIGKSMINNSTMILFSATAKVYAGDVDFYYRQENNLYYLTNLKQNNATLVLTKQNGVISEYLFIPNRDPEAEIWNGRMYSNEEATRISGIRTIIDANELDNFSKTVAAKTSFTSGNSDSIAGGADTIYLVSPSSGGSEYAREAEFASRLNGYKIVDAAPIFAHLRLVKSPFEIRLLQHAIDITNEALMRSMGVVGSADWEYEVHAEVDYTFRRRNADYWGYPSIVGCGSNATTLHYVESQGAVRKGDLMLMDVGAEYDHYTADVTRTFPVTGKFSKEQAEIYQIVYDAQEAAARTIKPGVDFSAPSSAANRTIREGLAKLGLITAPNASVPGTGRPQSSLFYMHGWGHWLGMNVHDVGSYQTKFRPGMVMTNEPGIYIREDALDYLPKTPETAAFIAKIRPAFEKYKNIGVRIEDDMLVTETGVEWMTRNLPRSISDVEAFMARASREMAYRDYHPMTLPFPTVSEHSK